MVGEEQKREKSFIEKKYKLFLIGIIILGFVVRWKYLTINQALWWDEAEYLAIAKHWAFSIPYEVSVMRPPLFPAIGAAFYLLGANELLLRLFMLVISLFGIYLTYKVASEIFDKRTALASAFLMAVFYLALFYTARIMIDILMMVLWLLAILFFWKGYVKKESKYYLWLMGLTVGLGSSLKMPFVLVAFPFIAYVFANEGFKALKNKALWSSVFFFFLAILPYFIYFNISYGGLPFISTPAYGFGEGQLKFGFYADVVKLVLQSPIPYLINTSTLFNVLLLTFLVGLGYFVMNLFIGWDLIKKDMQLKNYLFLLVWMIIPYAFFSMIEMAEDRYLFMIYPAVFMVSSLMFFKVYDWVKKRNLYAAVLFIVLILVSASYSHLSYADALIKNKAASYGPLKDAGLWIKERSSSDDLVVASDLPQNTYYAERNTTYFPEKESDFEDFIKEKKPKYMIISIFEKSPDWTYSWAGRNENKVKPVYGANLGGDNQKTTLVVFEFIYNSSLQNPELAPS